MKDVTNCFALHIASPLELGEIGYKTGAVTSNSDRWSIVIEGKGGHTKAPELTSDPIQVGS